MNNDKSTTKDQGFQAGVPGGESEQDKRNAHPDRIDPSTDVEIDDRDEGDEQGQSRQAGGDQQADVGKVAPNQQRK
jgi:hypothetical protein